MKKLQILPIILLLTVFLVGCGQPKKIKEIKNLVPTDEIKKVGVTLVLDFSDGKISTYSGIKTKEKTVFAVLKKVTEDKKIEMKIKEYSFGNLVEQIGKEKNTKDHAWIYFVNGKAGEAAADKKEVKDGDVVEWRYIKPQF